MRSSPGWKAQGALIPTVICDLSCGQLSPSLVLQNTETASLTKWQGFRISKVANFHFPTETNPKAPDVTNCCSLYLSREHPKTCACKKARLRVRRTNWNCQGLSISINFLIQKVQTGSQEWPTIEMKKPYLQRRRDLGSITRVWSS